MFAYLTVKIERSEHTHQLLSVPPWEMPLLELVHGSDFCRKVGTTLVRRAKPDAADEYKRLESRYRTSEDDGRSIVSLVYGHGNVGVDRLAAEIAKVPEIEDPLAEDPVPPPATPPAKPASVLGGRVDEGAIPLAV